MLSHIAFASILVLVGAIGLLYFYNIVKWGECPDFGFAFRTATGTDVIGIVTKNGRQAGMQVGDRILRVNHKRYTNFLQFRAAIKREPGAKNTYLLERDGHHFEITIPNTPIGFKTSFIKSGFLYLLGLSYTLIGTLVFLMKPHQRPSWIFFVFTAVFGLFLIFLYKLSKLTPFHLETFHIFIYTFTPAVIVHLASSFPEEKSVLQKYPYAQFLPYIPSALLFLFIASGAATIMDAPKRLFAGVMIYMALAVIFLLGSCMHLWLTSRSEIVKLRAKMILMGIGISASIPLLDLVTSNLFKMYILPGFNYYLPFFIAFPLSIGFAIVKHNLFEIDATIRRTFGYVLMTAGIALIYMLLVFIPSLIFGDFRPAKSPLLPIGVILCILYFFNFFRSRIQKHVDRIFYRLEYNYQETVERISRSMRSVLSLKQIVDRMMGIAERVLFAEKGSVMLLNRQKAVYDCISVSTSISKLPAEDPLLKRIAYDKQVMTRYDIEEDPLFGSQREACMDTFHRLEAILIVPLIYQDRLTGFLALGERKSGRFYGSTDVRLLQTLANQSAVAIENARLFADLEEQTRELMETNRKLRQEVTERLKIETELKRYEQELEKTVEKQTVELSQSRRALADLKRDLKGGYRFRNMVGKSEPMQEIYTLIKELADVTATVLITGESGTGKELVAEALHSGSLRKAHPMVKVNCSALSESVLESELFGHVKGAFTGADKDKLGRFQKAGQGVILLDEIGDVSLYFQKRLLRVLQEREFERLGDTTTLPMKARVIAATNQDLVQKVRQGQFREDLYYRLKVVEIKLPSLRERKEDIPLLIHHFLETFGKELDKKIKGVSPEVLRIMMTYDWPGNIRELRNTLEHISIMSKAETILENDLPADFSGRPPPYEKRFQTAPVEDTPYPVAADSKTTVLKALEQVQGNRTHAATILGISRRTLYRRLKEYQID